LCFSDLVESASGGGAAQACAPRSLAAIRAGVGLLPTTARCALHYIGCFVSPAPLNQARAGDARAEAPWMGYLFAFAFAASTPPMLTMIQGAHSNCRRSSTTCSTLTRPMWKRTQRGGAVKNKTNWLVWAFLSVRSFAIGEDLIRKIGEIVLVHKEPLQAQWKHDSWPELIWTSSILPRSLFPQIRLMACPRHLHGRRNPTTRLASRPDCCHPGRRAHSIGTRGYRG